MLVQAQGVADALGLNYEFKPVSPSGIWLYASPWGPVSPKDRFGRPGTPFAPPWPKVVIATGRAAIPYLRKIRKMAGPETFTLVLQDPKTGPRTADMIWVPAHDRLRGQSVVTTLTAPHSFSTDKLEALRASLPAEVEALPSPRIAVVLGGKNSVYKFEQSDDRRFENALRTLADLGASFMITPSRRTHKRLIQSADRATSDAPRIMWDGTGENPYPAFLAAADMLIVTADSVNMCGEACATGKPVYVFTPSGGSPKFERFHKGLKDHGATRPLPESFEHLETWSYAPLHSAAMIAAEIESRFQAHQGGAKSPARE